MHISPAWPGEGYPYAAHLPAGLFDYVGLVLRRLVHYDERPDMLLLYLLEELYKVVCIKLILAEQLLAVKAQDPIHDGSLVGADHISYGPDVRRHIRPSGLGVGDEYGLVLYEDRYLVSSATFDPGPYVPLEPGNLLSARLVGVLLDRHLHGISPLSEQ